jgi:hypothetical protein
MEYVMLISIITAAVVYMLPRVKRTTQSMIKLAADQLGDQKGADQTFNDVEKSYQVNSVAASRVVVNNLRTDTASAIKQTYNEATDSTTTSFTNVGWTKE